MDLNNNQPIKNSHGGKRPGSGRKKGAIQKLSGSELLKQIQRTTGKRFEQLLAEHYKRAYEECDWQTVKDYEKTILCKVIADKVEMDHTSLGERLQTNIIMTATEAPGWNEIPKSITYANK